VPAGNPTCHDEPSVGARLPDVRVIGQPFVEVEGQNQSQFRLWMTSVAKLENG
jgi:hypothetical protein